MRLLVRLEKEWWEARQDLDRMVQDATATKTSLPTNYWQFEHEARRKLEIARATYAAFKEGEGV